METYFYYTAWVDKDSNLLREGRTFAKKVNAVREAKQIAKQLNLVALVVKQSCNRRTIVFDTEVGNRAY